MSNLLPALDLKFSSSLCFKSFCYRGAAILTLPLGLFLALNALPTSAQRIGPGTITSNVTVSSGNVTVVGNTSFQPSTGVPLTVTGTGNLNFVLSGNQISFNSADHALYAKGNAVVTGDATNGSLQFTTNGNSHSALFAADNANVKLTGAQFTANGNSVFNTGTGYLDVAAGVTVTTGATVNLTGGVLSSTGSATLGAHANGGTLILDNVAVSTSGNSVSNFGAIGVDAVQGGQITMTGGSINTSGDLAMAIRAASGSNIDVTGVQVTATGQNSGGAFAQSGASVNLNQVTMQIDNQRSIGLSATGTNSKITGTYVAITTTGPLYSHGAYVSTDSQIALIGGSIETQGVWSYGVWADNGVTSLNGTTVTTSGANAYGLSAENGGTIETTGGSITTSGQNAHALYLNSGTFNATSSSFSANGTQSSALYVIGTDNTVTLNDTELTSISSAAITTDGDIDLALENARVNGANNGWLNAQSGTATITANASLLSGITNTAAATTNVSMQNGSRWDITGDSNLTSLSLADSTISFAAPTSPSTGFKTLTVQNYTGSASVAQLNVNFDNGLTDQIVIDGGQTAGTTELQFTNLGRKALAEQIDTMDIPVIVGINGAVIDPMSFSLINKALFITPRLDFVRSGIKQSLNLRMSVSFDAHANTVNQINVAHGLKTLDRSSALFSNIIGITGTANDAQRLYDSLSGEIHAGATGMLQNYDRSFGKALRNRITAKEWRFEGYPLWVTGDVYTISADSTKNTAKTKMEGADLTLGAEAALTDNFLLGLAFRYGNNDLKVNARHSKADIQSYNIGVYAGCDVAHHDNGILRVTLGGTYGYHNIDSHRTIFNSALPQRLKADYDANTWQVFGELGYRFDVTERLKLEPFAGISWNVVHVDSFHEKGGNAALKASSHTTDNFSSNLGLRGEFLPYGNDKLALKADIAWQHVYGNNDPETQLSFVGSDRFTIYGAPLARDAISFGINVDYKLNERWSLHGGYEGLMGNKYQNHGGYVKLLFTF